MKHIKTDILVIGAGRAGPVVWAAGAAQMGADVVLLEGHKMGGDCLNYGCVPVKALIATGTAAYGQDIVRANFGVAECRQAMWIMQRPRIMLAMWIATIAPVDSQNGFLKALAYRSSASLAIFISLREVQAGDTVIKARGL